MKPPGYDAERNRRVRAAFFAGKTCAKCGSAEQLELDHIDPATKVDHRIWSWRAERREAEIAKCRVLCRRCHSEQHAQEMRERKGNGTLHASLIGYRKRGCRCEPCVAYMRKKWKEDNDRRRCTGAGEAVAT